MRRLIPIIWLLVGASAQAGEDQVRLKDAPGKDVVQTNCATCHSLDYIPMNSPFLDRAGWEATVTKMIKIMGAPVADTDTATIVEYLAGSYGKGGDRPAP